jgi:ABC-type multidrug transport system fused ATPase/permease subunit
MAPMHVMRSVLLRHINYSSVALQGTVCNQFYGGFTRLCICIFSRILKGTICGWTHFQNARRRTENRQYVDKWNETGMTLLFEYKYIFGQKIVGNLEFKSVRFAYPMRSTVQVLCGLDFQLKSGSTLALVGPSGCGGSIVRLVFLIEMLKRNYVNLNSFTLNQHQICIYYRDTIVFVTFFQLVDSSELRAINPGYLRHHIALVSQEPILFDCSIRENILYGLEEMKISDEKIIESAKLANIHNFIDELPDV